MFSNISLKLYVQQVLEKVYLLSRASRACWRRNELQRVRRSGRHRLSNRCHEAGGGQQQVSQAFELFSFALRYKSGDFQGAIEGYSIAAALDPALEDAAAILGNLAHCRLCLGQCHAAMAAAASTLRLRPAWTVALKASERLSAAVACAGHPSSVYHLCSSFYHLCSSFYLTFRSQENWTWHRNSPRRGPQSSECCRLEV